MSKGRNTKSRKGARVASIIIRIFGLVFLVSGGVMTFITYNFLETAVPTTGTVVSISKNYSDDGGVTYQPTIRFIDNNGNKHQAETFISSSEYNYPIKSDVDILYDPQNPSSMRLDNWFETWGFGAIFLGVGFGMLIIASIVGRFNRKTPKSATSSKSRRKSTRDANDGYVQMELEERPEDHLRETEYIPTIRRDNSGPTIRRSR